MLDHLSSPHGELDAPRAVRRLAAFFSVTMVPFAFLVSELVARGPVRYAVVGLLTLAWVAAATLVYGARRGLLAGDPGPLDEREQQLRGRVHVVSHRLLGGAVTVAALAAVPYGLSEGDLVLDPELVMLVGLTLTVAAAILPSAVAAWLAPDDVHEGSHR